MGATIVSISPLSWSIHTQNLNQRLTRQYFSSISFSFKWCCSTFINSVFTSVHFVYFRPWRSHVRFFPSTSFKLRSMRATKTYIIPHLLLFRSSMMTTMTWRWPMSFFHLPDFSVFFQFANSDVGEMNFRGSGGTQGARFQVSTSLPRDVASEYRGFSITSPPLFMLTLRRYYPPLYSPHLFCPSFYC